MAQFETTGGGFIDSGDRQIIRKIVVSTDGQIQVPATESGYPLTNSSITQEAGGIVRGVLEYSQAGAGGASYSGFGLYGKRVELTGGTREVPIQTHVKFETMTDAQVVQVQEAVDQGSGAVLTAFTEDQELLYSFLSRKIEYVLAPAVVGRVTEVESTLPSLDIIAKVANPPELTAPSDTFWICTAVTASPIGGRYEVTREYTLSFSSWADVQTLYSW
jgi:hypothetical protein